MASSVRYALFDTAIGRCGIAWTDRGIARVHLPEADDDATRDRVLSAHPGAQPSPPRGDAKRAVDAMRAHLGGALDPLAALPLDDAHLPEFQRRVYGALRQVPPGQTVSYGELAARVGAPGAARAVGTAVGKNPFPVIVPCQRVVAAAGKLGGFSAHGGVLTKRRMLAIEGVRFGRKRGPSGFEGDLDEALAHLRASDPVLGRVIALAERPKLGGKRLASTFEALARSIVFQQLNGKAASTIHARLEAALPGGLVTPEGVQATADPVLRAAGLSRSKTLALRDLSAKTLEGVVPEVRELGGLSDAAIVERLVRVRGIGPWTVEMLLIFRLGRPDVLPVSDFGVRQGFQLAYRKRKMPTPKELARHGEKWRPFRSVAAWYMWRAVDLHRAGDLA